MRNKPAIIVHICFLLFLILIMSACGPKPSEPGSEIPGEAVPSEEFPPTQTTSLEFFRLLERTVLLDPAILTDEDALAVCGLVYQGLIELDASGDPVASLAVNWTISEDQLDYIFELRPNVTFVSGTPLNADALLANFNRWFDPASPLRGEGEYAGWLEYFMGFKGELDSKGVPVSQFDGIEKVDNLTILIHLNRLEPNLLNYLAQPYFFIVDPVVLAAEGSFYGSQAGTVSGTGRYMVSAWDDSGITFKPFPTYWGEKATGEVKTGWR